MIKKIIVSLCLLISLTTIAQEATSSPYSYYGIGDFKFKGTVENRSMGGISVFPDSIHLNLQNPAHFASIKLTNFAVGVTHATTKATTETQEANERRTSLDYLAVGIPIGKLGIAFGLVPYTSVGYKIGNITNVTNSNNEVVRSIFSRYNGNGGVNKVFLGAGYKVTKKINFGADFQYNFGTIETSNLQYQTDLQYGTRENNFSNLRGVNINLGLTYQTKLNAKHSFFSSIGYTPESKLKLDNSRNIEIVQLLSSSAVIPIEREEISVEDVTVRLPSKLVLGSGFGEVKKWLVGGEISFINNSVLSNRFNDINEATFENSIRYSIGGYYIPNYASFSDYYKKIVYRGGLRYENTGMIIQNKSITDFAANFGVGLPLGGTFSNINIGLEVGKRGTTFNNLVEENYVNLSLGLSLSDRWFVRRKFD